MLEGDSEAINSQNVDSGAFGFIDNPKSDVRREEHYPVRLDPKRLILVQEGFHVIKVWAGD